MRGRLYLVWGFAILALAVLASAAWVGFTIKGFVNSVEGFRSLSLPAERVVSLERKHYVLYYESHAIYAQSGIAPRMGVLITSAVTGRQLSTRPYETSLTYNVGSHHGVAEYTVDPPRAGRYLVRAASEVPGGRLVIGESIASLITRGVLHGLFALLIFFGIGGIGVLLLTMHDRKQDSEESGGDELSAN